MSHRDPDSNKGDRLVSSKEKYNWARPVTELRALNTHTHRHKQASDREHSGEASQHNNKKQRIGNKVTWI